MASDQPTLFDFPPPTKKKRAKRTPEQAERERLQGIARRHANREKVRDYYRDLYHRRKNDPRFLERKKFHAKKHYGKYKERGKVLHCLSNKKRRAEQPLVEREKNRLRKERWIAKGERRQRLNDLKRIRYATDVVYRRKEQLRAINHHAAVEGSGLVTAEQWQSVLDYFGERCAYCGRDDLPLTVDHVIPLIRGGPHDAMNLAPACKSCNCRKQAMTLIEFLFLRPMARAGAFDKPKRRRASQSAAA